MSALNVRINKQERAQLKRDAKAAGFKTISAYVRIKLFNQQYRRK